MVLRRAKALGILLEYECVPSSLGLPARTRRLQFTVVEIEDLEDLVKAKMQDVESASLLMANHHCEKRDE